MAFAVIRRRLLSDSKLLVSYYSSRPKWPNFSMEKIGIPPKFLAFIQQDIDFRPQTIKRWVNRQKWEELKGQHLFQQDDVTVMGREIAAAQFIIRHGGAVKFVDKNKWFKQQEDGRNFVPNKFVDGFILEAVDASNTSMMYTSFDNLANLNSLIYMNLSNCPYIDDWCLSRFHMFSDTLRFLDISGCPRVTEKGLATLHHLENLEGLNVSNLTNVDNKDIVMILLEEMLPKCSIVGIDYADNELLTSVNQTEETIEQEQISNQPNPP